MNDTTSVHLPSNVMASIEAARAAIEKKDEEEAQRALLDALVGVEFPTTYPHVIYPLVETLTPDQRRVAELIAQMDVFAPWERVPSGQTARRWLGMDPPGPLEMLVDHEGAIVPLWRALRLTQDGPHVPPMVATLPMPLRLDVLATFDGDVWAYRIRPDPDGAWAIASSIGSEARDWAIARLGTAASATLEDLHARDALGEQLSFFALVRAGHEIDPAWDFYLPIGTDVPIEIAAECARALPLDRLERVAPTLLERTHGSHAIQMGLAILEHHDAPAIARFVWTKSERSFPHRRDQERKALAAIGESKPGVADVVASLSKKAPKKRTLCVGARLSPRRESDLSELQAAQLIEAGKRWDGRNLPVARRLSLDENDESALGAILEHVTLTEKGKPAYEAWLHSGDSGTFFEAGTTRVVAQRIQRGIEIEGKKKDPALADALGRVGASEGAVRSATEVSAATHADASGPKKSPAKKSKKSPAKKSKKSPAKKSKKSPAKID